MEGKNGNPILRGKKVSPKFQDLFSKESRKNSPKPSTSQQPNNVPNNESFPDIIISDSVTNSYPFAKNKQNMNLIANPLDSNSSFLYHCFDENNSEVPTSHNPDEQALGKLIKNYLDDNSQDVLPNLQPSMLHPLMSGRRDQSPKNPYPHHNQRHLTSPTSNLPLNTRILSPTPPQPCRGDNISISKLRSPSLKPEVYNQDPFGNNAVEKEELRQSIKTATQNYESALKNLENVINRLSEPWPGRRKNLKESFNL